MSKILRIHNSSIDTLKGIQQSDLVTISSFQDVADPLSSGGSLAQKPGSSIPSIFARMIFFRMAFGGLQSVEVPAGINPPVYNQIISQCFDVLEALFNRNTSIEIEEFSFSQQKAALKAGGYADLYDALEKQQVKFMQGVDVVYLFRQNGQIIGGTSPYSIVFSSPNWNSGLPVVSLWRRPSKFREYIYKLQIAYASAGFNDQRLDMFLTYVEQCRINEPDHDMRQRMHALVGEYTLADFSHDYPHYKFMSSSGIEREVEILNGQLWLHSRDASNFKSDFFIKASTGVPFDKARTPLVLSPESHNSMHYYDDNPWPTDIDYPSEVEVAEGHDEDPRDLPGCTAYRHSFLTSVDFFEQRLIALPYPLNSKKFDMPDIDLGDGYHALLPIKPLFFKYFKIEELLLKLKITYIDNGLLMELSIPVRNDSDSIHNIIVLRKTYSLNAVDNDICYITARPLKTHLNVGIFPFYKSSNDYLNNYWVMMGMENASKYKEPRLAFFKEGRSEQLVVDEKYPMKRGTSPLTWYYQIRNFDYLQIRLPQTDDKHPAVCGLVIPHFDEVTGTGNALYHYAVDFGTTNSHIAYVTQTTGAGSAVSFYSKEIRQQAVYLNETIISKDQVAKEVNDMLRVVKAREFFPQGKNDNNNAYSFPIRTVTGETGSVDSQSELFASVSVGFHYPKEVAQNSMYKTSLKWDFLNSVEAAAENRGRLFFTELLWMIKNHWIMQSDINENDRTKFPVIMLTFPLGSTKADVVNAWAAAYRIIFGINNIPDAEMSEKDKNTFALSKITSMTESLAPCRKLLTQTGVAFVNGILNVDIGGGTTDMQFYQQVGLDKIYRYDSILYAGDDLWGMAYENVAGMTTGNDNNFMRFAKTQLAGCKIKVGNEEKSITDISLTGKELINFLLRDENGNLTKLLGRDTQPDSRVPRVIMFLHYAAVIYHMTNWLKANQMIIPATINFSGFGSKYIDMLFQDNDSLSVYTRALISKFWGEGATFNPSFKVQFEANPKNVTAEGAALYAADQSTGTPIPTTRQVWHLGYEGYTALDEVEYPELLGKGNVVAGFFDKFIDIFNAINPTKDLIDVPNATNRVPRLTDAEVIRLKSDAITSFKQVATKMMTVHAGGLGQLRKSMFVWALKNSIWKIGL